MQCVDRECAHCTRDQLRTLKLSTLLDSVLIPYDVTALDTGYNLAMRAIADCNFEEALRGCEQELKRGNKASINYQRAAILRAHIRRPTRDIALIFDDLRLLTADTVKIHVAKELAVPWKLCLARVYRRLSLSEKADEVLDELEQADPSNPLVHLVRAAVCDGDLEFEKYPRRKAALIRCSTQMPNNYPVQFARIYSRFMADTGRENFVQLTMDLEDLIKRFPDNIVPGMFLAQMFLQVGLQHEAREVFEREIKKFPIDTEGISYTTRGLLDPTNPESVAYFRKAIDEANPMDSVAYKSLFAYYVEQTHEYAKAFEVANRALMLCNERDDLIEMFDERQTLLQSVIQQNYWDRL